VDASELYAVFNGKPLADSELLSLAGVEEEQTLYILGRLLGGGKKRKKKTYTKPKKQKHKHKKIKLRVLKFYKVQSSTQPGSLLCAGYVVQQFWWPVSATKATRPICMCLPWQLLSRLVTSQLQQVVTRFRPQTISIAQSSIRRDKMAPLCVTLQLFCVTLQR
jgi:hypothetical protein